MTPQEFLDEFGTLAESAEGVPKLRELILELAVRGKLVEQDEDDEPATVLLERIATERADLVKQTVLRPAKPLPPIHELFAVPDGWRWAYFQDVFHVITDGDHRAPPQTDNGGVPFLVISNVRNGELNFENTRRVREDYFAELDPLRKPKNGDILYTVTGSYGIPVKVKSSKPFCVQRHIGILKPASDVSRDFLYTVLSSPLVFEQAAACATGIAQKTVPLGGLRKMRLPLPPLAEQHRIVSKVDELMGLCDRLEAVQGERRGVRVRLNRSSLDRLTSVSGVGARQRGSELSAAWQRVCDHFEVLYDTPETLPDLRQTILQLAVQGKLVPQNPNDEPAADALAKINTERERRLAEGSINKVKPLPELDDEEHLFEAPRNWEWVRVTDVFDVSGGITKNSKRAPVKNHFPYLRVANVQRGRLDLTEIKRFELVNGELERWHLEPRDLLVVEGNGSEDEIGRCAVWDGELNDCVHQNHIIRCRPIGHDGQDFTLRFFNSPAGINEMKARAITTSGLYSLSVGKIRSLVMPFPPLSEQKRIVSKVTHLLSQVTRLESTLTRRESTRTQLLTAAIHAMLTDREAAT